jgi:4-hydroxybenzoate polyprenyltransferase
MAGETLPEDSGARTTIPLCVDLDGTFIRSDLLLEGILRLIRQRPLTALRMPLWLLGGRARFKERIAAALPAAGSPPPVNEQLATFLRAEQEHGRPVYLVTASHAAALEPIQRLFPFDGVFATAGRMNLKGDRKADLLVERFGDRGFDYVGDSAADEAVWCRARKVIVVHRSARRVQQLARRFEVDRSFTGGTATWRDWLAALRIHQWTKNLLIALPILAGHHWHAPGQLAILAGAFAAMSLCASGTYLWNDLLDLEYDRAHPRKRYRMAARGQAGLPTIAMVSILLVTAGLTYGFILSAQFGGMLIGYITGTVVYSLYFKRMVIADMFVLAGLYLSRVVGGVLISEAIPSFWLFAFTALLFLSLAAAKRQVELQAASDRGGGKIGGRGYHTEDMPAVSGIGIASGVAACVVLGLYSHSEQVRSLYQRPEWLWGVCVVALYWVTRLWLLTHRGVMHDDPLVFTLKDRVTWLLAIAGIACVAMAAPVTA